MENSDQQILPKSTTKYSITNIMTNFPPFRSGLFIRIVVALATGMFVIIGTASQFGLVMVRQSIDTSQVWPQDGLWIDYHVDTPLISSGLIVSDCDDTAGGAHGPLNSKLELYEDGKRLGPPHSSDDTIRTIGGGAFSYICVNGTIARSLTFSTSDQTSPRTNGRHYKMRYPVTILFPLVVCALGLFLATLVPRKMVASAWRVLALPLRSGKKASKADNGSLRSSPYVFDSLLSLRGLAAFFVVCSHYRLGASLANMTGIDWIASLAVSGTYAVFIFFIISGYLMANILNTKYHDDCKSFYINRFIRIIPTYYLAVALTIFIDCDRLQLSDFYSIIFCYYNYSQSNISNPVLWSISTEIQFYLIAPLIAIAARSLPTLPIIIGAMALAIKLYYFNNHGSASAYMGLEVNLLYFMVGWCAYSFRHALPKLTPALGLSIMTMTLFLMWRYHWEYINPIDTSWDRLYASVEWMLIFPAILCVAGLLVLPGLDRKATNNGGKGSLTLQFLGVTSYMVYVIHDIAGTWFGPNIFIKFILVYWLAYTLHLIYEFPLYQLRRPVKEVL